MVNKECITESKKTLGVIRWDAWYGHDGVEKSVISEVEKTLSPKEFHFRAPFFAKVTEDNKIIIPEYTQEIFDREMEYAIEAGIDYFVYMFYADDMKKAREMHLKSKYKNDVKFAFFTHGFAEERVPEYIKYFKEDFYMTVQGGRPIIYYFAGFDMAKKCIEMLKDACEKEGLPTPYSVVCNIGTEDTINSGADAKGQYAIAGSKGMSFNEMRKEAKKRGRALRKRDYSTCLPFHRDIILCQGLKILFSGWLAVRMAGLNMQRLMKLVSIFRRLMTIQMKITDRQT